MEVVEVAGEEVEVVLVVGEVALVAEEVALVAEVEEVEDEVSSFLAWNICRCTFNFICHITITCNVMVHWVVLAVQEN